MLQRCYSAQYDKYRGPASLGVVHHTNTPAHITHILEYVAVTCPLIPSITPQKCNTSPIYVNPCAYLPYRMMIASVLYMTRPTCWHIQC